VHGFGAGVLPFFVSAHSDVAPAVGELNSKVTLTGGSLSGHLEVTPFASSI
jgi:hypothetical protein